jgi:hypothetical protein
MAESIYAEVKNALSRLSATIYELKREINTHNLTDEDLKRVPGWPVSVKIPDNGLKYGVSCGVNGDSIVVSVDGDEIELDPDKVRAVDITKLEAIQEFNEGLF